MSPLLLAITGVLLVAGIFCVSSRWYKEAFVIALPLAVCAMLLLKSLAEVPS